MSALAQTSIGNKEHVFLQALLAAALIVAVLALAVIGLDALNDLMARGFVSMRSPGS
jgi:hypothetical protein